MTAKLSSPHFSLHFENSVRQFLGDDAFHIADSAHDESGFRYWLRKCTSVMHKRIENVDTTTRHKAMMMRDIQELKSLLKSRGGGTDKEIIVALYWIVSRLMGFDGVSGKIYNEPTYYQTHGQYFRELVSWDRSGENWFEVQKSITDNTIIWRGKLYTQLKKEGMNDHQISRIFNVSEHEIKKLKYGL